ncbi:MAG: alpha/beta hydrolase [Pseudomonadota bacterium]
MPYANLGDVKIYYEIYGPEYEVKSDHLVKRPTIVALHGGPGVDHTYYDVPFLSEVSSFAQLIFIDQRGNGRSVDTNSENWNLAQWADDLGRFCEHLGLEKPFIYGCSMGGWVAMKYAATFQSQPGGLLLVDTEAYLDTDAVVKNYEKKGGKAIGELAKRHFCEDSDEVMQEYFERCIPFCSKNPIPPEWLKRTILTPEVNKHLKQNELLALNIIDEVKQIQVPILYLSNTTNPLHLLSSAKKTAAAMKTVDFRVFEDCGLVAMDAKEEALAAMKHFMTRHFCQ